MAHSPLFSLLLTRKHQNMLPSKSALRIRVVDSAARSGFFQLNQWILPDLWLHNSLKPRQSSTDHGRGFAHGDLHLGNLFLQLPSSFDHLTVEQLYEYYGEPDKEPVPFHAKLHLPPSLSSPPSSPSPSPWQAEVITIEDDAAPAEPITIDDDTESDCDLQQKEVNLEDIEKMNVEEDHSDSEDEGSLGQPALPQEQTFASLGALESYLHDFAVPLGFDVARSKWYGRKNEATGKMSRLYFRCCRGGKQDPRRKADSRRHTIKTECKWKVTALASDPSDLTGPFELRLSQTMIHNHGPSNPIALLQRYSNKKRKLDELIDSMQEDENRQGRESSALSEAELERMHPSGAIYLKPYSAANARRNTSSRNTTPRTPVGRSSAPRNSSSLAGQYRTDRPTAESQSSFQSSPPAPSQGRENNGRSLVSLALAQIQSALNEQMVEKQRLANEEKRLANEEKRLANEEKRLANEEKRLANEAEAQRQKIVNMRAAFVSSRLRLMESGEIEFDQAIFQVLNQNI
ncbi:hypothetical protein E4U60_004398 [Claviceps pazoutovae]|uniref:FAR1 domain-containing protein n=1 Tax=Claviceps pazoutovae TaxID=1649127 RepID=A0A9P7MGZ6_9HYPO|nr:hypothetical protein E4U60_004398 [Claviceps pazoutovae]